MASCERCWAEAFRLSYVGPKSQAEYYFELIQKRNCTPEQQAGPDAQECPVCHRKTIHQVIGECMNEKCKKVGNE